jgi:uncharacterized protein YqiB (DUF1249 family)
MRFRRLCPEMYDAGHGAVSKISGAPDLYLRITARSRYTASVHLTHLIEDEQGVTRPNPGLGIRIYYDARQAEVHSAPYRWLSDEPIAPTCSARTSLAVKWAANRFLYKWLCYCLGLGYAFPKKPGHVVNQSLATIRVAGG